MDEKLVRLWFGAVRAAADAGERELPEGMVLNSLQKAKLRILIRQDQCDGLSLCIRSTEGLRADAANRIRDAMYSDLMEDALAGVWDESGSLELARFLSLCTEGIGDTATFCSMFRSALGEDGAAALPDPDAAAKAVKTRADKHLGEFITERKKELSPASSGEDGIPPWLDEFEYIDWIHTH